MEELSHLIALRTVPGGYMESQSGLQRSNPQIYCRYELPLDNSRELAFIVFHPTSNFHGHYLIKPLARRNAAMLALNTRYVGNDSMLQMERALHDVGAGMRFLREQGYKKVVILGNSGGGALAAFYQQQAENPGLTSTPDGRPFNLAAAPLPAGDAIALLAAHPGRATQLLAKIDASVMDENNPSRIDASLDLFDPKRPLPLSRDWLATYQAAQAARLERITQRVEEQLRILEATVAPEVADDAFIIHRTQADPRTIDLTLDANDRPPGTLGGNAAFYNAAANGLGRFCTLRSFLSQWSPRHTRADGPACLADTSAPVMIVDYTADQTVFPSHVAAWRKAAGNRATMHSIVGAPHYLTGQQEMIDEVADLLVKWARRI